MHMTVRYFRLGFGTVRALIAVSNESEGICEGIDGR